MDGQSNRNSRDFRRYQLALRLMAHQARTHTIEALTSLTRHQQETLRKRWQVTNDMRYRGPSPTSLSVFLHSPLARSQGAALAVLCRILNVVPSRPDRRAARRPLSIDWGERLCKVYEAFRSCFPASDLELEEVLLLAIGLTEGELVELGSCRVCGATILIDRLAPRARSCAYCQMTEGEVDAPSAPSRPATAEEEEEERQGDLF